MLEGPVRTQMMFSPSREVFEANPWQSDPKIYMAKGALMGFLARCLSNMFRHKAVLWRPGYHAVWSTLGMGYGLALLNIKKKQLDDVERLRDKLVMRRMMREDQTE